MSAALAPPTSPDWDAIPHEVACPLCDYNLRGLSTPQCPECGFRFTWDEVTDPTRQRHPYLFEHHPERNLRAFRQTLTGTLLPRRFWRTLSPSQPPVARRLAAYWALTSLLVFALVLGEWARAIAGLWQNIQTGYASWPSRAAPPAPTFTWDLLLPMTRTLWHRDAALIAGVAWATFWVFFWPWLTLAALMVFRQSMHKARVNTAHVVRCLVYTFDVGAWIGIVAGLWAVASIPFHTSWGGTDLPALHRLALVAGVAPLLVVYRLWTAYRLYLRFDHAFWTILASQVIALLLALNIWGLVNWLRSP
jgi:hypothetical protein